MRRLGQSGHGWGTQHNKIKITSQRKQKLNVTHERTNLVKKGNQTTVEIGHRETGRTQGQNWGDRKRINKSGIRKLTAQKLRSS